MPLFIYLFIIALIGNLNVAIADQNEFTIFVDAGATECFYEDVKFGNVIDIEYQVIDGGHGEPDISFAMYDTNGHTLSSDYKRTDNIHRHNVKDDGGHRFCFDNSFSMFSSKTVFFEIIVESDEQGVPKPDKWGSDILDGLSQVEFVDMKVRQKLRRDLTISMLIFSIVIFQMQDIQESVTRIHYNLNRVKQAQDIRRSVEARDRHMAEVNNSRVGNWSMIQIGLMLLVGGIQVFMVRSLFDTEKRSKNIWSKFSFLK